MGTEKLDNAVYDSSRLRTFNLFLALLHKSTFQVTAIATAFAAIIIFISIFLLHDSYNSNAFDLGLFAQTLKSTLQGNFLYHSMGGLTHLAYHFSPVLLLLVPIYWIFPYVETLLVVQAILLGISGILVYLLARGCNLSQRTSLIVELFFFINPLVWGVALFDFHEVAFAIPALLLMCLGLVKKNKIFFTLGLFVALISKEDVIIAVGAFGFINLIIDYWNTRKINQTALVIMGSAAIFYGIAIAVSAVFSNGEFPRILSYFSSRYVYADSSFLSAILTSLKTFFSIGSLFLICGYLVPLGFLPLLSLRWSFAGLLVLLSGMISTNPGQHENLFQYPAAAIPFLFMAFIVSLPRLREDRSVRMVMVKTQGRALTYSLLALLIASASIISAGRITDAGLPDRHDEAINTILEAIPDGVSVTANNTIFPHICTRTDTFLPHWKGTETGIINGIWGYPEKDTEYVVVDRLYKQVYFGGFWEDVIKKTIDVKYQLILNIDGAKLYKLRQPEDTVFK